MSLPMAQRDSSTQGALGDTGRDKDETASHVRGEKNTAHRGRPDSVQDGDERGSVGNLPTSSTALDKSAPREKLRTSCDLCTARKKGCDGDGINPCRLCVARNVVCHYSVRPKRQSRVGSRSTRGSRAMVTLKRARMRPSIATGLVGMEESAHIGIFFDFLHFFPLSSEKTIRKVLFDLVLGPSSNAMDESPPAKREHTMSGGAAAVFGGALIVPDRTSSGTMGSGSAQCILWCTVALGALLKGAGPVVVDKYIRLADEAIMGHVSPEPDTLRAYSILCMVHCWLNRPKEFFEYLKKLKEIVNSMPDEAVPQEIKDMVEYHARVKDLHFTEDKDTMTKCAYMSDPPAPPLVTPNLFSDGGLFHLVHFYSDGAFRAFWRDVLKEDPTLSQTKAYSDKHLNTFIEIYDLAKFSKNVKGTVGELYMKLTLLFLMLPVYRDPMLQIRDTLSIAQSIEELPGLLQLENCLHMAHCILIALSTAALMRVDKGGYERLRETYNRMVLHGPKVPRAAEITIKTLCSHPFCRGMIWARECMVKKFAEEQARKRTTAAVPATVPPPPSASFNTPSAATQTQPTPPQQRTMPIAGRMNATMPMPILKPLASVGPSVGTPMVATLHPAVQGVYTGVSGVPQTMAVAVGAGLVGLKPLELTDLLGIPSNSSAESSEDTEVTSEAPTQGQKTEQGTQVGEPASAPGIGLPLLEQEMLTQVLVTPTQPVLQHQVVHQHKHHHHHHHSSSAPQAGPGFHTAVGGHQLQGVDRVQLSNEHPNPKEGVFWPGPRVEYPAQTPVVTQPQLHVQQKSFAGEGAFLKRESRASPGSGTLDVGQAKVDKVGGTEAVTGVGVGVTAGARAAPGAGSWQGGESWQNLYVPSVDLADPEDSNDSICFSSALDSTELSKKNYNYSHTPSRIV